MRVLSRSKRRLCKHLIRKQGKNHPKRARNKRRKAT